MKHMLALAPALALLIAGALFVAAIYGAGALFTFVFGF